MKMNGVRVICVCLVLLLAFSLIGCSTKNDTEKTSSTPVSSNENEVENNSSMTDEEEITDDEVIDNADNEYTEDLDDFFTDSSDDEYSDGAYVDELTVLNGNAPAQKNFLGLNGVYHCYPYLEVSGGRTYTEKQANYEINMIKNMGVQMVRSYYGTKYAYDETKGAFDWENNDMKAIYRWMKELQKADIEISLNAGWNIAQFVNDDADGRDVWDFYDGVYVHGDKEQSAKNYANWMVKSLQQFRAHGCNNVTSLLLFTEPGAFHGIRWGASEPYDGRWDGMSVTEIEDPHWPTYLRLTKALDKGLKDAGIRNDYLLVGPNEAHTYTSDVDGTEYLPMFYNALTEGKDYLDVFSHHNYFSINDMTSDVVADQVQLYWRERAELTKQLTGKPFWIDETNVRDKSNWGNTSGIRMENPWGAMQIAVMTAECAEIGVQNIVLWSLASQNWGNYTTNNDAFTNGVQTTGVVPSPYLTFTPNVSYYGISLLSKFFGRGDIYTIDDSLLHAVAEKGKDGEWTVLLVNMDYESSTFRLDFENCIGNQTFYRYLYNTTTQKASANVTNIGADLGIRTDDGHFCDTLPASSFAVYTTRKPN